MSLGSRKDGMVLYKNLVSRHAKMKCPGGLLLEVDDGIESDFPQSLGRCWKALEALDALIGDGSPKIFV